jgi:hypothetical protein
MGASLFRVCSPRQLCRNGTDGARDSEAWKGQFMIVKSIGVISVAKIYAAISAAMGLLFGIIFAMLSLVGAGFAESSEMSFLGPMMGVGAVIALPIFYGCMGFVAGAIGAALYNVFAGMVGGVRLDLEQG